MLGAAVETFASFNQPLTPEVQEQLNTGYTVVAEYMKSKEADPKGKQDMVLGLTGMADAFDPSPTQAGVLKQVGVQGVCIHTALLCGGLFGEKTHS